ncbi:MAG: hypothetical protein HOQ24_07595 [Mycobacteriaceae bacterium]|nr:hypothetical protein [Mycobacteriaceae bacterium]
MSNRKLDRQGRRAALETVRESPFIAAVVAAPAVLVFAVTWLLAGFGWALVSLLVIGALAYVGFRR